MTTSTPSTRRYLARLLPVTDYIRANLRGDLSVGALAKIAGDQSHGPELGRTIPFPAASAAQQ
jgi:hypothetical protein